MRGGARRRQRGSEAASGGRSEPLQHRRPRLFHQNRPLVRLWLRELLETVYERQHVRGSTCRVQRRLPLVAVTRRARAIGRAAQPVVAFRVADWTAARALGATPTHVLLVCTEWDQAALLQERV